jgi:hypothetical protein
VDRGAGARGASRVAARWTADRQHSRGISSATYPLCAGVCSFVLLRGNSASCPVAPFIELGAGWGIASLQLALLGVHVILVDWRAQAFGTAGELYATFGLQPRFVRADIL